MNHFHSHPIDILNVCIIQQADIKSLRKHDLCPGFPVLLHEIPLFFTGRNVRVENPYFLLAVPKVAHIRHFYGAASFFRCHMAKCASSWATSTGHAYGKIKLWINGIVREHFFNFFWQVHVFCFVKDFFSIDCLYCISRPTFDYSISIQRFWNVLTVCVGKYLTHVHNVVMDKITPPPFHVIAFGFMVG